MSDRTRLVLLSFLMLFVELALIRWTGENVVYMSFFSNFVLLGSFLGIGLGFLRANRPRSLFPYAPLALLGLIAFVRFVPVEVERHGSGLVFFGALQRSGPPREVVLPVVFLVVAAAMMFIADGVARVFKRFDPLDAYKWDLIGSIAGIAGFSALSFLRMPPVVWGVTAAVIVIATMAPKISWIQVLPLIAIVMILAAESFAPNTSWSPYYKVKAERLSDFSGNTFVWVNGVPHQLHQSVAEDPPGTLVYENAVPPKLDDVLVIGAGGGNDVAIALDRGAKHVDAVEIDPRLYDLGKSRHPDKPYADPRVDAHITDGRAFLEQTDRKYDLIVLALTDSLTLVSGQSSLRLESYLFTKEAIQAAREHLKPGGVFGMYNYYREPWLSDRFANTLRDVFGTRPCSALAGGADLQLAVYTASERASSLACDARWQASVANVPAPATDDHPFPYLKSRTIPGFYLSVIALILIASLALVRIVGGPLRPMFKFMDLFFMGAAFLLLETKSVVQFALLFGTTWFVNALVFAGVLISVLVAVAVSRRVTIRRRGLVYIVLLASLALAWSIPPADLLDLAFVPRFIAAVTLAFFPIFVANVVFTQRFKEVGDSTTAFGANLLGAMFGGLLEYTALITGYRALLFLVAGLYGLAFFFGREHRGSKDAAPVASDPTTPALLTPEA